jgi:hypothetical protein
MDSLLGFDFYGTGNIGDDLMLDGFLGAGGAADTIGLQCVIRDERRITTLARRFPAIQWTSAEEKRYRTWIGVGDTPIQSTSGPWFLNHLRTSLSLDNFDRAAMVGIGVEREAVGLALEYGPLLRKFRCIGTRDEQSADLLIRQFGCGKDQVVIGEDLAHASPAIHELKGGKPLPERKYSLGAVICGGDGLPRSSLRQFRRWLAGRDLQSAAMVATEVRPLRYREVDLHRRWTRKSFWSWRPRLRMGLIAPAYWTASTVQALIEHFCDIQCVLSSRYHGLLTAAWLGCRVAAIARGSKIEALARDLDIPVIGRCFRVRDLDRLYHEAHPVDPKKLDAFANRARAAVKQVEYLSR